MAAGDEKDFYLFIIPMQGKGLLKPKLSDIVDLFVKSGCEVVIYPTQSYHDAYKKVMKFKEDYDIVVLQRRRRNTG